MKLDHLIYGTFPDLPGSQQVVYKSPNISPDLESWLIQQYDQFGDCKTEDFRSSLTFQWYRETESPVAVLTKVTHAGQDFSGRWGALLRHSAIISENQFFMLCGSLDSISSQLVESGTWDELSKSSRLAIADEPDRSAIVEHVIQINLAYYEVNLQRLLGGQRLVLYSELNTEATNSYLQNLLRLIPLNLRRAISWSELTFRESNELDLSVVYSSRYSASESEMQTFQSIGENSLSTQALDAGSISVYLQDLRSAITTASFETIWELIFALNHDC